MVQIFQGGSKFSSKISSGGSIFIKKLVLGGTNLGGGVRFYHDRPTLFMAFSISSASMSVLPLTAYSICNTRGFIVSTVRRNFERSPPVRAAIVDRAGTRSSACSRPTCVAGLLRAQLKAVLALNIILTRGPFSKPMATHARFYSPVATRVMIVLSLCH